jgi:two-component system LytT family response regulator
MILRSKSVRSVGAVVGIGFLYWLVFLVALQPGVVTGLAEVGMFPEWRQEALRVLGASLLGALASPIVSLLTQRFPIAGMALRRYLAVHGLSAILIALGLIVASCLLAPLAQVGDTRPFATALPDHLAANWLLLAFSVAGLTAVLQAAGLRRVAELPPAVVKTAQAVDATPAFLAQVRIKSRGRVRIVELSAVDRIEAQGNYVALHCGRQVHLLRETLSAFEAKLDPAMFVRVHRSHLIATARIAAIRPLANGDGLITLIDGAEVRLSRGFREQVHARVATPRRDG